MWRENTPIPETEPFSNEIKINDLYIFLADPIKWYYKILGFMTMKMMRDFARNGIICAESFGKNGSLKDEVLSPPILRGKSDRTLRIEKVKKETPFKSNR
jgi:hypothetical protein